jgi:thioredoxin reductase
MDMKTLPVAVVGAGPVGLAAAAHLLARGLQPIVFEAGPAAGHHLKQWGHVRMFSPWEYALDRECAALLAPSGWTAPPPQRYPTGAEIVRDYLEPLATRTELRRHLRLNARVTGVTRLGRDVMKNAGRDEAPFLVRVESQGAEQDYVVQAVIDASGTYGQPNPLGTHGLPAAGERTAAESIAYGMPDVLGAARARYAGKRVLVVGSGHSAFNVLMDLATLASVEPEMQVHWAVRRPSLARVLGGGENDALVERGRLGLRIGALIETGAILLHTNIAAERVERTAEGLVVHSGTHRLPAVDEIVVATGFRPDTALLAELRLDLDPATQSPRALAPLIDPNQHSCGTVRPHGAEELQHPERGVFVVGMKSYGRAPTFLLLTGYEQVRSVAAALAGDWEAARRVELVLPETGVCNTDFEGAGADAGAACCGPKFVEPVAVSMATESAGCCGGPAPNGVDACCAKDADAKAAGEAGCGCGTPVPIQTVAPVAIAAAPRKSGCCS